MCIRDSNGLEKLYNEQMQKDEALKMEYEDLLKHVVDKVITKMKDQSPEFQAIYSETHYRKAFFDELRENSSQQELDLNIVLFHGDLELLGAKNLCMLRYRFQGYLILSREKMRRGKPLSAQTRSLNWCRNQLARR